VKTETVENKNKFNKKKKRNKISKRNFMSN